MDATFASSSVVRCEAPARNEPGAVTVAVSIDGGASFGDSPRAVSGHFRYVSPSLVKYITPRAGPDSGGTAVTVHGTGFSPTSEYACTFGNDGTVRGDPGGSAMVMESMTTTAIFVSSLQLTCIAPPVNTAYLIGRAMPVIISMDMGDGWVAPVATSAAGDSVKVLGNTFTFMPGVKLTGLNPDSGPITGGTVVHVGGANLAYYGEENVRGNIDSAGDTVWCRFGSAVVLGSRLSDGLLRCTTPPVGLKGAGDVEVAVSVNGGADFTGGPAGSRLVKPAYRLFNCQLRRVVS